jgi:hypothetical protein
MLLNDDVKFCMIGVFVEDLLPILTCRSSFTSRINWPKETVYPWSEYLISAVLGEVAPEHAFPFT